ncbi:MAG: hypothetical protein Tsb0020_43670 [Haliangiales bacterium]
MSYAGAMATYDAATAECFVFTFKEGLLSKIAHDLKIRVARFQVDVDDARSSVTVELDAGSLEVVCAMRDGVEDMGALSGADRDKIGGQIQSDVLHSRQHPKIRFVSSSVQARDDGGFDVAGDLTLHGVTKPITAKTVLVNERQEAEVVLHQPDYGVKPYKAMMGTLKVQADVKVKLSIPA